MFRGGMGRVDMIPTGLFSDPRMRFLLGGGSAALLNWLVRFPLSYVMPFTPAVLASLAIGMAYGFVVYRFWLFGSKGTRPLPLEIRDFLFVNAGGAAVTIVVAVGAKEALSFLPLPATALEGAAHALGIAAGALVNYLGHKHVTFRA